MKGTLGDIEKFWKKSLTLPKKSKKSLVSSSFVCYVKGRKNESGTLFTNLDAFTMYSISSQQTEQNFRCIGGYQKTEHKKTQHKKTKLNTRKLNTKTQNILGI